MDNKPKTIFCYDEIGKHKLVLICERTIGNHHKIQLCHDFFEDDRSDAFNCYYFCIDHKIEYCSINSRFAIDMFKRYSDKI